MNDNNSKYTNGAITIEMNNLCHTFDKITHKVADATVELSEKTISAIKKHPVQTAMTVGAVGLIAGAIAAVRKK
ncbi:MAG: hypothetical protein H7281_04240 [Bacteriovorax sp.]|nr:hypothetical protein [Bacteriovorax sp.]